MRKKIKFVLLIIEISLSNDKRIANKVLDYKVSRVTIENFNLFKSFPFGGELK